jgi:hypothetical protein
MKRSDMDLGDLDLGELEETNPDFASFTIYRYTVIEQVLSMDLSGTASLDRSRIKSLDGRFGRDCHSSAPSSFWETIKQCDKFSCIVHTKLSIY